MTNKSAFDAARKNKDPVADLQWAAKASKGAIGRAEGAEGDLDVTWEFTRRQQVIWGLIAHPRRYTDLESSGVLAPEKLRAFLRAAVSAGASAMYPIDQARNLVPLEISRAKKKVKQRSTKNASAAPAQNPDSKPAPKEQNVSPTSSPKPKAPSPRKEVPPIKKAEPAAKSATDVKEKLDVVALGKKILADFENQKTQTHYEFLGVNKTAPKPGIKTAYARLARTFHPDTVAGTALEGDEEIVAALGALFHRLQDAYRVLSNDEERQAYDAEAPEVQHAAAGKPIRRSAEASMLRQKGDALFRRKDYGAAIVEFENALLMDDEDMNAEVMLAWCLFLHPPETSPDERARASAKALTAALKKKPHADGFYKLGIVRRQLDGEAAGVEAFKQALKVDKKHADAAREVRLYERRLKKKKSENKGVFGSK